MQILWNAKIGCISFTSLWFTCAFMCRNLFGPVHLTHYSYPLAFIATNNASFYRKSPVRSRTAYIRARLVEWVYKPWLLFRKCFPDERLGWLVYEKQHLPIYIHLQATACKRGSLKYESRLFSELFFQTNITTPEHSRAASVQGLRYEYFWEGVGLLMEYILTVLVAIYRNAFNKQWCGKFLYLPHDKRGRIHRVVTHSGC